MPSTIFYAIYSSDENYGYVTGISFVKDSKLLTTTQMKPEAYLKGEVPMNAPQVANIKTFSDRQAAQRAIEELASCENIENKENLVVKELKDSEIEFIERCRKAYAVQSRLQEYAKHLRKKKVEWLKCGNTAISEMIIGEMNYQIMARFKSIKNGRYFRKAISVYCHRCSAQIL